jgi:hypothetical protein
MIEGCTFSFILFPRLGHQDLFPTVAEWLLSLEFLAGNVVRVAIESPTKHSPNNRLWWNLPQISFYLLSGTTPLFFTTSLGKDCSRCPPIDCPRIIYQWHDHCYRYHDFLLFLGLSRCGFTRTRRWTVLNVLLMNDLELPIKIAF